MTVRRCLVAASSSGVGNARITCAPHSNVETRFLPFCVRRIVKSDRLAPHRGYWPGRGFGPIRAATDGA